MPIGRGHKYIQTEFRQSDMVRLDILINSVIPIDIIWDVILIAKIYDLIIANSLIKKILVYWKQIRRYTLKNIGI